ncbi:MAG TPA: hypothetical protein VJG32_18020 [Anaerolineae bacterium]|nr:hypothetical protein [Anaerolineae bacterium]
MARISDVYELTSKANTGGIKAGSSALNSMFNALKRIGSLGAAPFNAARAGMSKLVGGVKGVLGGLGSIGHALNGVRRIAQVFSSAFESMKATSPAFARQLGRLQSRLDAVKNALAKKAGDALAPILERIVKVMDSPRVQKFIDLIGNGLQKALSVGLGFAGRLLNAVGDLFTEFEDGSRPIDSVRGVVVSLAKSFGLSDEAAFQLGQTIQPVADFIENQLIPGLLTLGQALLSGVGQAWQTLQQIVGAVWGWLKTNVFDPLFNAAEQIAASFQQHWGEIQAAFNSLWQAVQPVLQFIIDKFSELVNAVLPTVVSAVQGIVEFIGPAVANIAEFIRTHFDEIKTVVENIFGGVRVFIETAINTIGGVIRAVLQVLSGDWSGAWNTIKGVVEGVWNGIKGIIEKAVGVIGGLLNILGDALRKPWEALRGIVEGVWNGVKSFLVTAINGVIDFINGLIKGFNDTLGQLTGQIQYIPRVTSLAQGGIVNAPILAAVGDNPSSPEVVSPLDDLVGILRQALGAGQGGVMINFYGNLSPEYTPRQAGQELGQAFLQTLRAQGTLPVNR